MDLITTLLSNAQVWTIVLSGIAGLIGAMAPIVVARYQTRQAAIAAKCEVDKAAENARVQLKATARKDAVEEWQALYGERQKEVAELKDHVCKLQAQNNDQQGQLNTLTFQHQDCEERHAALEQKVESLTSSVVKIANGGPK